MSQAEDFHLLRGERLARLAQFAGLIAILATLTGFLLLMDSDRGAALAKIALPVAALMTPVTLVLGVIARWRLRKRPRTDRALRFAFNGTTLAIISALLLFVLMIALPSNHNAVRHLRKPPPESGATSN